MNDAQAFEDVAIVGAGAWGTALASLCANNGSSALLWAREPEVANAINARQENQHYLPGVTLPASLFATPSLEDAADRAAIVFVVPAQFSRPVMKALGKVCPPKMPVILCSKGVERGDSRLMTEVLKEVWPSAQPAVLSGPSFARDVAQGLPTAVTLACQDQAMGARWAATLGARHFRPYLSDDLIGAELGGAVKNVIAIAAGAVVGKKLGESARAALIARGFAEFQRLGRAMGAKAETMAGLSGLGDLILTAGSPQSRNMSLGMALGEGRPLEEILSERSSVSEGAASADAVVALAKRAQIEMPICAAVAALIRGDVSIDAAIDALLSRPFKNETL